MTGADAPRPSFLRDRALLALLGLAAAYLLWDASRGFSETDEFWYGELIRSMLARGDPLTPWFDDRPDWSKPPLYFWLACPFVELAGLQVGLRVLSGLAFLGTALLVYLTARSLGSLTSARLATAAFLFAYDPLHLHVARAGTMDALLNLIIAAVLCLLLGVRERPRRWLAIGALVGAAFLLKTAFAAIPLGLALATLWLLRREQRPPFALLLAGACAAAAVALPWFVVVFAVHGRSMIDEMFLREVVHKALGVSDVATQVVGGMNGNQRPLFAARHVLAWGQPWTLLLPLVLLRVLSQRGAPLDRAQLARRLAAVWIVGVLALFVATPAWGWYTSSIYFPLALLIGWLLGDYLDGALADWAPPVEGIIGGSLLLLETQYTWVPYARSSGLAVFDAQLELQLAVVLAWVYVARASARRAPARPLLPFVLPIAAAWCLLTHEASRGLLALVPIVAVGAAWLTMRRPAPRARQQGHLVALALVAAACLLAPLRFAASRHEPARLLQVRALLDAGAQEVTLPVDFYAYVVIFHALSPTHVVRYERETGVLRVRAR